MSSGEERAQQRAAEPRGPGRRGETPGEAPKGRRRFLGLLAQPWVWLLVGLLVLNWLLTSYVLPRPGQQRITIPYTTFKEQVLAGNVSEITSQGDRIQGTFKQAVTYPPPGQTGATGTPQGSQGSLGAGRGSPGRAPDGDGVPDPAAHVRGGGPGGPAGAAGGHRLRGRDPDRAPGLDLHPALLRPGPADLRRLALDLLPGPAGAREPVRDRAQPGPALRRRGDDHPDHVRGRGGDRRGEGGPGGDRGLPAPPGALPAPGGGHPQGGAAGGGPGDGQDAAGQGRGRGGGGALLLPLGRASSWR